MQSNWEIAPRRGNEHLAQGIALGDLRTHIVRPVGATALNRCSEMRAFGLTGRLLPNQYTLGDALGYGLVALTGRRLSPITLGYELVDPTDRLY